MKMSLKIVNLGLACVALAAFAVSNAQAAPVLFCKDGPGIDLVANGCISGTSRHYSPDTTDGLYRNAGGGDPEEKVEQAILGATGSAVNIFLYGKSDDNPSLFSLTGVSPAGQSGTWAVVDNTVDIAYITVMAANSFALYEVSGNTGSWSTVGILNNGNQQPTVSHISFWTTQDYNPPDPPVPPSQVPAPGTLLLLALPLLGFGLRGTRRKRG